MKNKYGNYVILKILSTSETDEKKTLAQSLIRNVNSVNVPKYKSRWIQFLEENPMKIPGITAQTIKTSNFKPATVQSDSAGMVNGYEVNSPKTADQARVHREERSQFYQNNGGNNQGWEDRGDDQQNFNSKNHQGNWAEQRNNRYGGNNYAQNGGSGNNSAKKTKNFNQKFYEKNQGHANKGGYNNNYY